MLKNNLLIFNIPLVILRIYLNFYMKLNFKIVFLIVFFYSSLKTFDYSIMNYNCIMFHLIVI
jgi:hypothetical protein